MKIRTLVMILAMLSVVAGMSYAADDQASLGTQAGTAAKELQSTASETLTTGAMKVTESSRKVEAEVQETVKTLQQQWDVLAKQLQEKTKQIQAQLQVQWQDFQKSFNKNPQP